MRQFGWLVYERGGVVLTLLPYNYGDLPLHWTYIRHLAGGASFWPENPVFTGARLRYPLGVDLLGSMALQLGAALPVVLRVSGLLGAGLTALALRRWGGAFAVAGFLCAGGLAGFRILETRRLVDYQAGVEWKSLFLALLVPQRGFLLALPAGLLLLWHWRRRLLRGEAGLRPWVEGAIWGALPLVHLHTFLFVSLLWLVWVAVGRRWREAAPGLAIAFLPAAWAGWEVTGGPGAASLVGWSPGWTMGDANPLVFLAVNFGLFLPLALVALAVAVKQRQREHARRARPRARGVHRAVLRAARAVGLGQHQGDAVVLGRGAARDRGAGARPAAAGLARGGGRALPVLRGGERRGRLLRAAAAARRRGPRGVRGRLRGGRGTSAATSGVATAQVHNHPVALCGQPIVAGYAGHLWSHGIDARAVQAGLARLMNGEGDYRAEARALHARYLFWGPREHFAFPRSSRPWEAGEPLARGEWGALYRLD